MIKEGDYVRLNKEYFLNILKDISNGNYIDFDDDILDKVKSYIEKGNNPFKIELVEEGHMYPYHTKQFDFPLEKEELKKVYKSKVKRL